MLEKSTACSKRRKNWKIYLWKMIQSISNIHWIFEMLMQMGYIFDHAGTKNFPHVPRILAE